MREAAFESQPQIITESLPQHLGFLASSLHRGGVQAHQLLPTLFSMLYVWMKTVVGALLAANFSIPLVTVLANRDLWDEPMAVLAGNMSLT